MCRIAGIINPSLPIADIKAKVGEMCLLQKHGGPDDEGFYTSEKHSLVFGHRRLALIDLSPGGHQPMSYANERYHITYNGELYNYPELKEELIMAGFRFSTQSDTEVILAAFAAWGRQAFGKFNGMYAFALWDTQTENVYLVRDPSGIKPLYYAITKQGLAFASETRALRSIPDLNEASPHWQIYLMAYGHLPEPVTTLKEVKPLTKGCFIRYHVPSQKWDMEVFGYYSFIEKLDNREEVIAGIREKLLAGVKRHLLSDAPIGVFLSGGIDSSIVALLAKKVHSSELKTLSIVFNESKYSEQTYQDLMVKQLNCDHHRYLLQENEFHQLLPGILQVMDQPSCDGINTWFISKSAKENGLKAVLSGIGGDELFGGYPSFRRIGAALRLAALPNTLLRSGRYSASKKIRRLAYLSIPGPVGMYLFLRGLHSPRKISEHLGVSESEVLNILSEQPILSSIRYQTPKNQASWIETNLYMQNQLLRDSDVMSMAHGIEIRVPFLDAEFVKYVLAIQSEIKFAGTADKQLLVDSFRNELPEPVWKRDKMGFSFPFAEWLINNEMVKDVLLSAGKKGETVYEEFSRGKIHWSQMMTMFLWYNQPDA